MRNPLAADPMPELTRPAIASPSPRRRNPSSRLRGRAVSVALLCIVLLGLGGCRRADDASHGDGRPDVLLITIDTLRRDRLGLYGYTDAVTPRIDRLGKESVVFREALTVAPHTGPAHISMLTGLYPHRHGATANGRHPKEGVLSLPRVLAAAGYTTAAFISGWTLSDDASGLASHFEVYDEDVGPWPWFPGTALETGLHRLWSRWTGAERRAGYENGRSATAVTDAALHWLRQADDRPFFGWVHYFDPHDPYSPPDPYLRLHATSPPGFDPLWYQRSPQEKERFVESRENVATMRALYDGEISYVDAEVGRLVDALEELERARDALLVLTADHGESLGEHDYFFDHDNLYQEILAVPLLIRYPRLGWQGEIVGQPVELVDLLPTLLELAGLPLPPRLDGESLQGLVSEESTVRQRPSYAFYPGHGMYSVRLGNHKLIRYAPRFVGAWRMPEREELFDLAVDPDELEDLAAERPHVARRLRRLLDRRAVSEEERQPPSLDPKTRRRLESLGYN